MGESQGPPSEGSSIARAGAPDEGSPSAQTGPRTVLLISLGIGLIAGFLDLGSTVIQTRLLHGEFYRLGHGFPWIIPSGVAALILLPGLGLALAARLRRRGIPLGIVVGLLSLVGFLDVTATLPLELWSSLLLAAGLSVQTFRLVRSRPRAVLRFARLATPALAAGVLALAMATSGVQIWAEWRAAASLPPPPPGARNVLLIVWDTVRAGNLSAYGYNRRTTPNLERLTARGVRFEHAYATSSWTLPSHASLFTGRWPHELSAGWSKPLDATEPTLAGRLGSLGYDTAGFVANLDYCGRETGLARGFAHYEDYPLGVLEVFTRYIGLGRKIDRLSIAMVADLLTGRRRGGARPLITLSKEHVKTAGDVDRAFLGWLSRQRPRGRPFFAFLNYNDAHTPYEIPDDPARGFGIRPTSWRDRMVLQQWNLVDKLKLPVREVQMATDLYDDAIAHLDRRLGTLLDELGKRGVLDDTLVVVTSDHGEHLGDHLLFFHGCSLYRQVVEVPLVIVDPKAPRGLTVAEPVSLRDLPTTILDLLGLGRRSPFPGRSLARFQGPGEGGTQPGFEPLLMETEKPTLLSNQGREPAARGSMQAIVAGGMHYIRSGDGREELYALDPDPAEEQDASGLPDAQGVLQGFRGALRSMLRSKPAGGRTAGMTRDRPLRD